MVMSIAFMCIHQFQAMGIASALIKEIEQQALQKNISKIFAEVSITAKSFFLKRGFRVTKNQIVTIRCNSLNLI